MEKGFPHHNFDGLRYNQHLMEKYIHHVLWALVEPRNHFHFLTNGFLIRLNKGRIQGRRLRQDDSSGVYTPSKYKARESRENVTGV